MKGKIKGQMAYEINLMRIQHCGIKSFITSHGLNEYVTLKRNNKEKWEIINIVYKNSD